MVVLPPELLKCSDTSVHVGSRKGSSKVQFSHVVVWHPSQTASKGLLGFSQSGKTLSRARGVR